jgi:hypothetical protein
MRRLAVLAVGGVLAGGQISAQPATPSISAETVLFRAADALGMLRGLKQEDSLTTLEFWAKGSVLVNGAMTPVSEFRGSVRFHAVPSMRIDAKPAAAKTGRFIHAVAGPLAWDESAPGIYAGAAPPGASNERLLRVLSLPPGVVKTARAAGKETTVAAKGDRTVLTFPVGALSGATMTATFSNQYLVERVEARHGDLTLETAYSGYGDWNDRDYKSDVQFPQRIVQKRGDVTVLDLTVTKTNTYNPYVVVPVPAQVKAGAKP